MTAVDSIDKTLVHILELRHTFIDQQIKSDRMVVVYHLRKKKDLVFGCYTTDSEKHNNDNVNE